MVSPLALTRARRLAARGGRSAGGPGTKRRSLTERGTGGASADMETGRRRRRGVLPTEPALRASAGGAARGGSRARGRERRAARRADRLALHALRFVAPARDDDGRGRRVRRGARRGRRDAIEPRASASAAGAEQKMTAERARVHRRRRRHGGRAPIGAAVAVGAASMGARRRYGRRECHWGGRGGAASIGAVGGTSAATAPWARVRAASPP